MTSGARKDPPHIDKDGVFRRQSIDGVVVREVRNVVTANSITTEIYRPDWGVVQGEVRQAIHVSLRSGAISAWHQHRLRWDYFFVVGGHLRLVLYDPREDSTTRGQVDVYHESPMRPAFIAVPPWIWHGLQNLSHGTTTFINFFDRPYDYDDPDEWRLPPDSAEIPYQFP